MLLLPALMKWEYEMFGSGASSLMKSRTHTEMCRKPSVDSRPLIGWLLLLFVDSDGSSRCAPASWLPGNRSCKERCALLKMICCMVRNALITSPSYWRGNEFASISHKLTSSRFKTSRGGGDEWIVGHHQSRFSSLPDSASIRSLI